MRGVQTAVTRGSAAALRAISGPMPAGSPTVMPTTGRRALTSDLERDPVGDGLEADVAIERLPGFGHGGVGLGQPLGAEPAREVGERRGRRARLPAAIAAGGLDAQVADDDAERVQPLAQ